jgi:hypothetical protein
VLRTCSSVSIGDYYSATGAPPTGGGANQKVFACRRINLYHLKYVQNSRLYGDLDTYGSWLRGDERGFVANGQVLPGRAEVLQADRKRQKSPTVRLNGRKIKLIRRVIFKEAGRIGHEIEALAVCTNHVHLYAQNHRV